MYVAFESEGREPLGRRILEVPADAERTKLQDPHSGFIAHVPVGSIKRGETLAATGRRRPDGAVRHVSRAGVEGPGGGTADRRSVAELPRAPALRPAVGCAERDDGGADETDRRESHAG